jgi:hypothetical protein
MYTEENETEERGMTLGQAPVEKREGYRHVCGKGLKKPPWIMKQLAFDDASRLRMLQSWTKYL